MTPLWRKIQRENFIAIEPLLNYLEFSEDLKKKIVSKPRFVLNLPRRLAEKIQKNTIDDPILRQFIPLIDELTPTPGFVLDPVQDQSFRKAKKLLHKYKGRALLVTTSACAMNCRFCFRQNFPYETDEKGFDEEIGYIREDHTLSEVILSGGDPLSLSDEKLSQLFTAFETIPHLKRIRFHTRFPVGIPERITDPFLKILTSSSKQIFFIIHVNHPKELDREVIAALKKIQLLGVPIHHQSVLLKGINDDEKTQHLLCETLINNGITPYYLHLLDPVEGASHFATSPERGPQIIRYLQEHLSGFGVPRLVREISGQPSKTFINN